MSNTLQPLDLKHRMASNNTIHTMASSTRKMDDKRELVKFSVRAQDFILKKGMHKYSQSIDVGNEGIPIGLGSYAPGSDPNMNNYLDDSTGLAGANEYATDPENENMKNH